MPSKALQIRWKRLYGNPDGPYPVQEKKVEEKKIKKKRKRSE